MDFNDSQQEAAFRKEARDFLEANAEKRSIISDKPNDKSLKLLLQELQKQSRVVKKQLRRL